MAGNVNEIGKSGRGECIPLHNSTTKPQLQHRTLRCAIGCLGYHINCAELFNLKGMPINFWVHPELPQRSELVGQIRVILNCFVAGGYDCTNPHRRKTVEESSLVYTRRILR